MPQKKNNVLKEVVITIIFDNNSYLKNLQTDWGFACLVEFENTKILFDTGDNGEILLCNMEKLKIDPSTINYVFLSHFHHDHTNGLKDFLDKNSNITIYYPQSFPEQLINIMKNSGAKYIPVSSFKELLPGVFSLGEMGDAIPEQSLAIKTTKGIIVITGCAHPGIINILEKAKSSFPEEKIYFALGGFHLHKLNEEEINEVIQKVFDMEIETIAPTHCTGSTARSMFKDVYDSDYIEAGTGKEIIIK